MLIDYYIPILYRTLLKKKDKVLSYGELNPDKIIYIITRDAVNVGMMSYITVIMGHIDYAIKKGYYPVVDMKNYKNTYLEDNKVGVENSWEYYFEQPTIITLDEAYQSKNVIISSAVPINWPNDKREIIVYKKMIREKWIKIAREYIRPNKDIIELVNEQKKKLWDDEEKVLGVKLRGTDYFALKPKGHSRQPSVETAIGKIKKVMYEQGCKKIFLSTEDKYILERFRKEFEGCLIFYEQFMYDYDRIHYISDMKGARKNDAYLQGLEYLTSLLLLDKCNCFIGGRNGGTIGVLLFENKFTYEYVWNLGYYI